MAKYHYTLSNLFPEGQSFRVQYTKENKVMSGLIRFEHGVTYETEDEVLITSIKRLTQRFPNTNSNKQWLDDNGIESTLVPCQACGGRVMKLEVHHFMVKEV